MTSENPWVSIHGSPLKDLHQHGPSWATPEGNVSKVPSLVPLGSSTPGTGSELDRKLHGLDPSGKRLP